MVETSMDYVQPTIFCILLLMKSIWDRDLRLNCLFYAFIQRNFG